MKKFPFFKQLDTMMCGVTCLQMICKYYGKNYSHEFLYSICYATAEGISLLGIKETANNLGFCTISGRLTLERLSSTTLPCILHWNQNHFVVLYKIKKGKKFYIADPAKGLVTYTLEPTPAFYSNKDFLEENKKRPLVHLF